MTMPPVLDPVEQRKRQLIALLNARQGIYAPPAASPQVTPVATQAQQSGEPTGFLGALSKGLKFATSGEAAANALLPGNPGTDVRRAIESVPVVGKPAAWALDVATSPLTLATAGFGGALGAGVRAGTQAAGIGGFGRLVAPVVEPLVQGPLAYRVGAAVAGSAGTEIGTRAAEAAGLPAPLQFAAGLAGGAIGIRTVGNAAKMAARNAGGLSAQEVDEMLASGNPIDKFTAVLSKATKQRTDIEGLRSAERAARSAKTKAALEGVTDPLARERIINRFRKGEMPTQAFTADLEQIGPEEISTIRSKVSTHFAALGREQDEANATHALSNLLLGQVPTPSEIGLLEQALGTRFAQTISKLGKQPSLMERVWEIAGVPRAVMSSVDVSMPIRQGGMLASRKEWRDAWKPMVKALGKESYAREVADDIATSTHPAIAAAREQGIFTGLSVGKMVKGPGGQKVRETGLATAEEAFMGGDIAHLFPGVRASERAAVTFLNKLRADYVKNTYDGWINKGVEVTQKDMDDLLKWASIATGRGALPDMGRELPVILNNLFFSPRFLTSRLQALNPKTYADMNPLMRQEAVRDALSYFGPGIGALTMLGVAGKAGVLPGVSVEIDPRSTDFGKVKIGQTRIDPWGGFQPIARFTAQMLSGQAKGSDGEIDERNRVETLGAFVRSKTSPLASFAVDALTGTTFSGQEVDLTTAGGWERGAVERMVPLLIQDMAEAIKTDGTFGALKTAPAAIGFGVQTYNSKSAVQNEGAQSLYKKPWNRLTGEEQIKVREAFAEDFAKVEPPSPNSARGFMDRKNTELMAFEQQQAAALARGEITNRDFTRTLVDANTERIVANQAVMEQEMGGKKTTPDVVDRFFALRNQATVNGIVDYELLDQLQHNYLETLPADDQRIILERAGFQHSEAVKWWVDARKTIADSGYYKAQSQAAERLAPLLKALGAEGMTYNQIAARAGSSDDPAEKIRLAAAMKRVDALSRDLQKIMRVKNPELDKALALVYGSKPILMRG